MEAARLQFEAARRESDLTRMSELQYGVIPDLEKRLEQRTAVSEADAPEEGGQPRLLRNKVTAEEIAEVVGKWTGIPDARLLSQEKERLLHLEQSLAEKLSASPTCYRRQSGCSAGPRRVIRSQQA